MAGRLAASLATPPGTKFNFIAWDFDSALIQLGSAAQHVGLRMSMDPVYSPSSQSAAESGSDLALN
jgi:hypothetical protein